MAVLEHDGSMPEIEFEWDDLAPGGEISATVIMASGFVLQEGQRVRERYRVVRNLGEGAMGQVLAVTLVGSTDQQTYALKVVARPVDANADGHIDAAEAAEAERHAKWFAELLRAEAAKQDVVQRHGVSVARLFALVQLDDGSIGMRMELARGRSLEAMIEAEKGRASAAPEVLPAVMIVRKLVSQLRRLHEMKESGSPFGFIHSDIKPGNVFLDDSDPTDLHVTLLDFGVATAGQAMAHDLAMRVDNRKTFVLQQTGGTLGYAPPYHFTGKATPLSDIYAAIVILYEMITLDLPWDFGDLAQSADNILMLEAAMLTGPRPVRAVRPSIPERDATLLDEFFRREFKALHELGESASQALSIPDEDVQAAITERLARLARDYQGKLDQLRARFSPSRNPPPPAARPIGERETLPSLPRTHAQASVAAVPAPAPEPEGIEVVFDAPAPTAPVAAPAKKPSRLQWVLAVLALPLAAVPGMLYLRDPPRTEPPPARAVAPTPTDAGVAARDAGAAPRGVSLAALGSAPVVNLRARLRGGRAAELRLAAAAANGAPLPAGAARCSCIAAVRGARVVASGGALGREVVLCTASEQVIEGRAEFFGSGTIPAEVFQALPNIACRGGEALELSVQRYSTAGGTASLFHCRRVAEPVAAPHGDETEGRVPSAAVTAPSADAGVAPAAAPEGTGAPAGEGTSGVPAEPAPSAPPAAGSATPAAERAPQAPPQETRASSDAGT